jgi:hypothetical protein
MKINEDFTTKEIHPMEILPECVQMFKRLEDKVDFLVENTNIINGRYQKHIEESYPVRSKVDELDKIQIKNDIYKNQMIGVQIGIIVTIFVQVCAFSYLWGNITKEVQVNTSRWERLLSGEMKELISNKGE